MPDKMAKRFKEGGLKSVALGAGTILLGGAAEAYRAGELTTALMLAVGGAAAFAIHEALTQYQFTFADDFREFVAESFDSVDKRDPDDAEAADDA